MIRLQNQVLLIIYFEGLGLSLLSMRLPLDMVVVNGNWLKTNCLIFADFYNSLTDFRRNKTFNRFSFNMPFAFSDVMFSMNL